MSRTDQDPRQDAPGTEDGAIRVAVLGSCLSRDPFNRRFNPDYRTWYRVTLDQHMPTMTSLMSPPTPIGDEDIAGLPALDAAKIRIDFTKGFLSAIASDPPDYLLVDFSGEVRMGILRTGDDRWVTHHDRLRRTPWYAARRAAGRLDTLHLVRDTDEYLERWASSLEAFRATLARIAPQTAVVLQRGQQTTRLFVPGTRQLVDLAANRRVPRYDTARELELWEHLDTHALATCGWHAIDLRHRDYPTSDAHPWGARYLHFSPDRYPDFLAALNAIHLERTAASPDPGARSMAAFIASREDEKDRGRPWDAEPGRGCRPPRLRRRHGPVARARSLARRVVRGVSSPNRAQVLRPPTAGA